MEVRAVNGHGGVTSEGAIDVAEKTPQTIEVEVVSADQRDAQALARLGKKPVLKVRDAGWKMSYIFDCSKG